MLSEFRSTNITWDKATSRIYAPVTANESDENGRKLVVQVINSGQVEDLTGTSLHLYWITTDKRHNGLDVFKAVDLKKGEFELSYTTGMLSNQGVLNANLVLIDTVGRVVSERFKITVTEGIDNDAIQSENSFSSLTQALIDISNLEQNYAPRLNDLTAQLQQTEQSLNAQLAEIKTLDIRSMGLTDKTSLNQINSTIFSNVVLNFENKQLTLDNNLKFTLFNCQVINLNLKTKGYNTLRFTGNNYSIENNTLDGIEANRDYYNKTDTAANLFIALEAEGNNVKIIHNTIKNYISRQGILLMNSNMFEIKLNKVIDCYSYNRVRVGGTFDNYGDGIHVTYAKNGVISHNEIINSIANPIGRCGIVIEFECKNIIADYNNVSGYDRGVHIELVDDLITISKNKIVACNVPMMIWNCHLSKVDINNNYFSDAGLDYSNPLHATILEAVYKGLISVLGDYKTNLKNNSNVIFRRNEVVASPINKYKVFLYIENSFHVKFRDKNTFINQSVNNMTLEFGSDNVQKSYYIDFEDSIIEGELKVLYHDFINLKNNKIKKIYFYTKPTVNLQITGLENRVIENNVIQATRPTGGSAFSGYTSFIFKDNTIFNVVGDYVFNNQSGIVEGNKFIRNSSELGILDLTLVRNSGRYKQASSTTTLYGTKNNLFMDEVSQLFFNLTPNGVLIP